MKLSVVQLRLIRSALFKAAHAEYEFAMRWKAIADKNLIDKVERRESRYRKLGGKISGHLFGLRHKSRKAGAA